MFASESSSIDSDYLNSVLIVRGKLKRDLQKLRKGFGGTELVTWILENQELFANFGKLALTLKPPTKLPPAKFLVCFNF